MGFPIQALDHVALAVGDQEVEESWYRDVLGLEREYAAEWGDSPVALMGGGSGLALFDFEDHGPAHSIYFEDPAGLRLELTTYEP